MNEEEIIKQQKAVCQKYGVEWYPYDSAQKMGISKTAKNGKMPINGLRHFPENGTSGWYVWEGKELRNNPDLFDSMHTVHLAVEFPMILKYLGLPPGYRFQIDDKGYEDVWIDEKLLTPAA